MTLGELIRRVRTLSNDKVDPYFWSDEEITDWLNDAVIEACVRGRLVHEAALPEVCTIEVIEDQAVYPIHQALYELTHLSFWREGAAEGRPVQLVSTEWLDAEVRNWRACRGTPLYAIQDDTALRLVPSPLDDGELRLEGYRLPMGRMALDDKDTATPEINQAHHVHLIQWALFQGFSIPDMESFDPARAAKAEGEFERYFGLRPDSDLRRITREDVPHVTEAFWP